MSVKQHNDGFGIKDNAHNYDQEMGSVEQIVKWNQTINMKKPACILLYTKYVGTADRADQYCFTRKTEMAEAAVLLPVRKVNSKVRAECGLTAQMTQNTHEETHLAAGCR
jgi:hypothetical protein